MYCIVPVPGPLCPGAAGVHMLEHFKECAVNGKRLSGTPELRLFWDEGTQAWSLRAPPSPSAASSPPPETSSQPPETSTIPSGSSSQPPEISTIPPGSSSQPPEKPTDPPGTCGVATQASAEGNRQGSEAAEATGAATGAAGKAGKGRPAGQQQGLFYGPPALRNAALKFQGALSEVAQLLTDRNLLVAACHNQLRVQGRSPL